MKLFVLFLFLWAIEGHGSLEDFCRSLSVRLAPPPPLSLLEALDTEGRDLLEMAGIKSKPIHDTSLIPWERGKPEPLVSVAFEKWDWGLIHYKHVNEHGSIPAVGVYLLESGAHNQGKDHPFELLLLHPRLGLLVKEVEKRGFAVHLDPAMSATQTNAQFHPGFRRLAFSHKSKWHEAVHEYQHLVFATHFGVDRYRKALAATNSSVSELVPKAERKELAALGLEVGVLVRALENRLPLTVAAELMATRAQLRELERVGFSKTHPQYLAIERYALAHIIDADSTEHKWADVGRKVLAVVKVKMPHLMNTLAPRFPFE